MFASLQYKIYTICCETPHWVSNSLNKQLQSKCKHFLIIHKNSVLFRHSFNLLRPIIDSQIYILNSTYYITI